MTVNSVEESECSDSDSSDFDDVDSSKKDIRTEVILKVKIKFYLKLFILKKNVTNKIFGETVLEPKDFSNIDPILKAQLSQNQAVKVSKIAEKKRTKAKRIDGKKVKSDPKICPNFDACKGKGNTSSSSGKRHYLLKNCPYVLNESDRNELKLIKDLDLSALNEVILIKPFVKI